MAVESRTGSPIEGARRVRRIAVLLIVIVLGVWLYVAIMGVRGASSRLHSDTRAIAERSPNWILVTRGQQGLTVWLDSSRVSVDSGFARIEVRMEYGEPLPVPHDTTKRFSIAESEMDVNCSGRRIRDREGKLLTARGEQVGGGMGPSPTWTSFEQHPLSDYFFAPLCRTLGTVNSER